MRKAVEMGADVVGAIPHYELTREYGDRSVRFAMELAAKHGRMGLTGRVTASHTTAMHSYNNNAYPARRP